MARLLQDRDEFESFCELMKAERVRSYLEIGSFSGGSIEMVAEFLPTGSRIVSVDKPWKPTKLAMLKQTLEGLRLRGYDTHLIVGDSTDPKTVAAAEALCPYDAVFIDGDHRVPYIKSDWENYGTMGRIVGFHDIARDMPKDVHGGPHEVASFWNEFKKDFHYIEFISAKTRARTDTKAAYGIGVVWHV
jgi:predicted O-methyltransferase YrrM